jgi:hypothetical protein
MEPLKFKPRFLVLICLSPCVDGDLEIAVCRPVWQTVLIHHVLIHPFEGVQVEVAELYVHNITFFAPRSSAPRPRGRNSHNEGVD